MITEAGKSQPLQSASWGPRRVTRGPGLDAQVGKDQWPLQVVRKRSRLLSGLLWAGLQLMDGTHTHEKGPPASLGLFQKHSHGH